ncbi:hypothetical protein AJ80_01875 [Polytolypa hystricis UAMH7299]|uniref:Altered inheritance of mitochondria protein 13, mitochondrial n=1 Tax=Polytolypa hystricis (strain UAMH7299) TaxID=1447883 RepID=A0A2B7Z0M8_POLH7|nr:hypothetical protein AJ80_01875 [Polytolypa hystricis UAMH7299]
MGAGGSKPAATGAGTKHVFTSDTPVQFSQGLVESLQSSSETDFSRSQTLELHIQSRVTEELERIRARESQTLADLEKRLADESQQSQQSQQQDTLSLEAPRVPFAGPGSAADSATSAAPSSAASKGGNKDLSSVRVQEEIAALKTKLAGRRRVREVDEGVEKARETVVQCLTKNEGRPLNCWEEVQSFKREVGRLEKAWVEKVVG